MIFCNDCIHTIPDDCSNGADEMHCDFTDMIPCKYDYPIAATHYISKAQKCDGNIDCKYGTDELDCNLTSGMTCIRDGFSGWIPPSYICDLWDWSDCDSGEYNTFER